MSAESRLRRLERQLSDDFTPPTPVVESERGVVVIYDVAVGPPPRDPNDRRPVVYIPDNGRALSPSALPNIPAPLPPDIPEPSAFDPP